MTRSRAFTTAVLSMLTAGATLLACSDDPTGPGHDDGGDGGTSYAHDRAAGASARDLLAADDFEHLIVQVQYVEGFAPTDQGLEYLEDFLTARLDKPGGVEIRVDEPIASPGISPYEPGDVRTIEAEHRTRYTRGDTLAVYLLYLDGSYENGNVLGIAYNNTSAAIFAETIAAHTGSGPLQPRRDVVEGTVAMHELGHLLGLVDNGSDMQTPHRDTGNGSHCSNEGCLMYYAVRTTGFLDRLIGTGPPQLDEDCIDDLRANGGR